MLCSFESEFRGLGFVFGVLGSLGRRGPYCYGFENQSMSHAVARLPTAVGRDSIHSQRSEALSTDHNHGCIRFQAGATHVVIDLFFGLHGEVRVVAIVLLLVVFREVLDQDFDQLLPACPGESVGPDLSDGGPFGAQSLVVGGAV
jgi:hypothetical protein